MNDNSLPPKSYQPTLVGFVIDVSSSMRRNWKNRDGRRMPQIEVIKEALNRQAKKIKVLYASKPDIKTVDLFCVGMGFRRPMKKWQLVDLANNREIPQEQLIESMTDATVVCDILALTEIIPTKVELQEIEERISAKWSNYSSQILQKVNFRDSLYDDFVFYIRGSLQTTALKRLNDSFRGNLLKALIGRTLWLNNRWLNHHTQKLKKWKAETEKRIEFTSFDESFSYTENIKQAAEKIFQNNADKYEEYIRQTLDEFVSQQSSRILELLTLGHAALTVFDTFDENKAYMLAEKIYGHLEEDIQPKITGTWIFSRRRLKVITRAIKGKLNDKKVEDFTKQVVKKVVWDELRPFVKIKVIDIFKDAFKKKAKERFYEWIDLSTSREIVRSIKDIANILPDALEQDIYSDDFMFGATPIYNTLKKVSLRFTDKRYAKHQKVLVIISDGEFTENAAPDVANLLRKSGVTIVNLYISNKNIASKLVEQAGKSWPIGAKMMFEMSSISAKEDGVSHALRNLEYRIEIGKKLFIQVNHSQALEDILDALLINE
ncbi:MAG: VWA domain-containing protein [Anaerolineales bacterium]|nr:VWA domain-containing protein [Anaerolineales bacterium]